MVKTKLGDVMQKFWMSTSIRGVPRALKSSSKYTRAFWALTMICCLCMLLYQLTTLLVKYYKFIVAITASDQNLPPPFPDVTICNLNPYSAFATFALSYGEYLNYLTELREKVKASSPMPSIDDNDVFWQDLRSQASYISTQKLWSDKFIPYDMNSSFIVDCTWYSWDSYPYTQDQTGRDCKIRVKTFWEPVYYQCYNYYYPANLNPMGFSSILYLGNFPDYLSNAPKLNLGSTYSAGIRILIHSPNSIPLLLDQGIDVSPGTEVIVGMGYRNLIHLVEPYSDCTTRSLLDASDPNSYNYRQRGCLTSCRQQQYIDVCGCLAIYEAHTLTLMRKANNTYCSKQLLNGTNEKDVLKLLEQPKCHSYFWPKNELCNCPTPCKERRYDTDITSTDWPNIPNQLAFYNKYIKPHPEIYGNKFDVYGQLQDNVNNMTTEQLVAKLEGTNLIRNNFVQVNIKYLKPHYGLFTDMPSLTWDTLFANVGGSLNLWMGITIMFAAEVVELLVTIFGLYFSKNTRERKEENQVEESSDHSLPNMDTCSVESAMSAF